MIEVGDWVQITSNDGHHNFRVGQIVKVLYLPRGYSDSYVLEGFVSLWRIPQDGEQFVPIRYFKKI